MASRRMLYALLTAIMLIGGIGAAKAEATLEAPLTEVLSQEELTADLEVMPVEAFMGEADAVDFGAEPAPSDDAGAISAEEISREPVDGPGDALEDEPMGEPTDAPVDEPGDEPAEFHEDAPADETGAVSETESEAVPTVEPEVVEPEVGAVAEGEEVVEAAAAAWLPAGEGASGAALEAQGAGTDTPAVTPDAPAAALEAGPATGLTAPSVDLSIGVGESVAVNAAPVPQGATCALSYQSSRPKVASVSADGVVKGHRKGRCTVTVTSDGGLSLGIAIRVEKAPKRIHMDVHGLRLAAGETAQLSYTLYGGSSRAVFTSSNPAVAVVEPLSGLVTAVGAGRADITVRTHNGKTARCLVFVDTPDANAVPGQLEVTFMNIGHNDGILLCCDGEYAFFDSGEHPQGVKAKRYLLKRGITHLKYYVGTHGHEDHLGGAPVILEGLDVDTVLVPHKRCIGWIKRWAHGPAERAATRAANYHIMKPREVITLGGAQLTCLGPIRVIKAGTEEGGPENRNSLVLRLTHGVNSFLLTGDALGGELVDIHRRMPGAMQSMVLKNPHHDKAEKYAIKKVKPQIVVFSTSSDQLPPRAYVRWLKHKGIKVYITASNRNGRVTMYSDGSALQIVTQK